MNKFLIVIAVLLASSCARDNPRIFGGINTDIENENQIVLSYDPAFQIGDILKDTYKIAKEHCERYEKKAILISKQESILSGFTTVSFECKKQFQSSFKLLKKVI